MIENMEYGNQLLKAARIITNRAHEAAAAAGVTLSACKWRRGHEVANLDNFWLTLESGRRVTTRHFPNAWLEGLGKADNDRRVAQCLLDMMQALAPSPGNSSDMTPKNS